MNKGLNVYMSHNKLQLTLKILRGTNNNNYYVK